MLKAVENRGNHILQPLLALNLCNLCLFQTGNEVVNFTLMVSPAERNSEFLEEDEEEKRDSVISTMSVDSGIEGDLPLSEIASLMVEAPGELEVPEQQKGTLFSRRACVRWPKAGNRMNLMMEAIKESGGTAGGGGSLPKEEKHFTARLVFMGDDSTLGRLAKAFHNIRYEGLK